VDSSGADHGLVTGPCDHSKKTSGSIKRYEYLKQLISSKLLKTDSALKVRVLTDLYIIKYDGGGGETKLKAGQWVHFLT
jgi:hypothetical protein